MKTFTDSDLTKAGAAQLDAADSLAHLRERFFYPESVNGKDVIYLCGNSLGLQPKNAPLYINEELSKWAALAVEGHFEGRYPWVSYHECLTNDLAALVGAQPGEVVAMNTVTVNLHLMLTSFYRPTAERSRILMGFSPFPSDRYAVASHVASRGYDPTKCVLEMKPSAESVYVDPSAIIETIDRHSSELALILLEGVNYYTGQALAIESICRAARKYGIKIGLDLAHAVGNIPLQLHDWEADFAVWCSYKYLNGGPGCVGGCFVHSKHADSTLPRLAGWWGHDKETRFKMGPTFVPISGAEGWQISNTPIFSMAALRASLEIFRAAGMERLRQKSIDLTRYLEALLERHCQPGRIEVLTPRNPEERGCQLSLRFGGGKSDFNKVTAAGVMCDWREPDVVRIAPTPLYNSYSDLFRFIEVLNESR